MYTLTVYILELDSTTDWILWVPVGRVPAWGWRGVDVVWLRGSLRVGREVGDSRLNSPPLHSRGARPSGGRQQAPPPPGPGIFVRPPCGSTSPHLYNTLQPSQSSDQGSEATCFLGHLLSSPVLGEAALCHSGESAASAFSRKPGNRKSWIN